MKKIITEIKQNKLLLLLTILTVISIIIGLLFPSLLKDNDQELIKNSITEFIKKINENKLNHLEILISSSWNNILITIILLVLGISLIGIPIIVIIHIFKCFITGFSITSILITYGPKGIITAIIYSIPNILNTLGSLLISYYAISFSITIFKCIFKKENKNWNSITKQYTKLTIFFILYSVIISILESYVIPNVLYLL